MKLHSRKVDIGVTEASHPNNIKIDSNDYKTWFMSFSLLFEVALWHYSSRSTIKFDKSAIKRPRNGTTFTFGVNKAKKLIYYSLNGKLFKRKVEEIPDSLRLIISGDVNQGSNDVEFVRYFDYSSDALNKDEAEGFDFVMERFADLKVPLANQTIRLVRSLFMYSSKIPNFSSAKEFKLLSHLNLDIDQKKLHLFMLGKTDGIEFQNLQDYYLFFKHIGNKHGIKKIITRIRNIPSFKICHQLLRNFCLEGHENSDIRNWFFGDAPINSELKIGEKAFRTSFAFALFNRIKIRQSELTRNPNVYLLDDPKFISKLIFHVTRYKKSIDESNHEDFGGEFGSLKHCTPGTIFKKMNSPGQDKPELFANIKLKTKCGHVLYAHLEFLILRLKMFHLIFRFGGQEVNSYRADGCIDVVGFGCYELYQLVHFAYEEKFDGRVKMEFGTILKMISHAHSYMEKKLMDLAIKKLENYDVSSEKLSVEKMIQRYGDIFRHNDEICEIVMPTLLKLCGRKEEDFLMKILKKEVMKEDESEEKRKILRLEKELLEARKRVKFLEAKVGSSDNLLECE